MKAMHRFLRDTAVGGRFFPAGTQIEVIVVGDLALVPPAQNSHTTLCAVPSRDLVQVKRFRLLLANLEFGLLDEQERFGLDADDVIAQVTRSAPGCEILSLDEVGLI